MILVITIEWWPPTYAKGNIRPPWEFSIAIHVVETMERHITRMLDGGWEILAETPHSGNSRI